MKRQPLAQQCTRASAAFCAMGKFICMYMYMYTSDRRRQTAATPLHSDCTVFMWRRQNKSKRMSRRKQARHAEDWSAKYTQLIHIHTQAHRHIHITYVIT